MIGGVGEPPVLRFHQMDLCEQKQSASEAFVTQTVNVKHRSRMSLIYACGLRRGELLSLKLTYIDRDRKVLWVRGGKGAKNRGSGFGKRDNSVRV